VASTDGVEWQIKSSLDVPAVSLVGGTVASMTIASMLILERVVCCGGGGGGGIGRESRKGENNKGYEMVSTGLLEEGVLDEDDDDENDIEFLKTFISEISSPKHNLAIDDDDEKNDEKKFAI